MGFRLTAVVTTVIAALAAGPLVAQELRVACFQVPLLCEADDSGSFVVMMQEMARRSGIPMRVAVLPAARANLTFQKREADALLPVVAPRLSEFAGKYGEAILIYQKREFIFVRQDTKPPSSLAELHGKTVGVTIGYRYGGGLRDDKAILLEEASNDVLNMRKLAAGKIDAFVCDEMSGLKAIREAGADNVIYNPATPLAVTDAFLILQPDSGGTAVAAALRRGLQEMRDDGSYARIFGP